MRSIADASAEQSDAILQINTGVDQISAVVSANSAAAVGSASASEELSGQSLILKNMIARFKLSEASQDDDYAPDDEEEPLPSDDEQLKLILDDEDDKY
jgi:methyl-accepting chemotaxis protein